jgi:FkbM family methyltransferase
MNSDLASIAHPEGLTEILGLFPLDRAQVINGAVLEGGHEGIGIETPATAWAYAIVIEPIDRDRLNDGHLLLSFSVLVTQGAVGILLIKDTTVLQEIFWTEAEGRALKFMQIDALPEGARLVVRTAGQAGPALAHLDYVRAYLGFDGGFREAVPARPGDDLLADIAFILGSPPKLVVDVGSQHGDTTMGYLQRFPQVRAYAFEADEDNFRRTQAKLAPYGERVQLSPVAVSDVSGSVTFNVNSHDGTHSVLDIGEERYFAAYVEAVEKRTVPAVRLDDVFGSSSDTIDLLHMDIQGGELAALRGAANLLRDRRIRAIYCEVEIYPLYKGQPLLWDIGAFLHARGFKFYSFYDRYYHPNNPRVLSWADALFICDELVQLPEHAR